MQNKTPLKTKAVTYCTINGQRFCLTRKQYKTIRRLNNCNIVNIGKTAFMQR